jgi:hypothetical protein
MCLSNAQKEETLLINLDVPTVLMVSVANHSGPTVYSAHLLRSHDH